MKCSLCGKSVKPNQSCVRVIVEEVVRDEIEDGTDPAYWSSVEDWEAVIFIHSSCVQVALSEGRMFPYREEIGRLKLGDVSVESSPQLRLVQGGKL